MALFFLQKPSQCLLLITTNEIIKYMATHPNPLYTLLTPVVLVSYIDNIVYH